MKTQAYMKSKFCTYLTCAYAYNAHPFCPLSNFSRQSTWQCVGTKIRRKPVCSSLSEILACLQPCFYSIWPFTDFFSSHLPEFLYAFTSNIAVSSPKSSGYIFLMIPLQILWYVVNLNLVNGRFPYVCAKNKPRS